MIDETRGQYRMTIARCRADDTLCGPLHAYDGYMTTLCGYAIDENWWSFAESSGRKVTCKRCARLKRMTQNPKTI